MKQGKTSTLISPIRLITWTTGTFRGISNALSGTKRSSDLPLATVWILDATHTAPPEKLMKALGGGLINLFIHLDPRCLTH